MSHELLHRLLSLTLISSLVLMVLLPLRPLLRRHGGPVLAYASWLLLPLSLLASLLPKSTAYVPVLGAQITTQIISAALPAATQPAVVIGAAGWWLIVWGLGAALMALLLSRQQWRFQRGLGRLVATETHRVYRADAAHAMGPLLLGLLRPRIVLPADFAQRYSADEQALIIAHETVHLQRGDMLANGLAAALRVVFWFNPLLHWAASRFRFDQELACDAAVLQRHPQSRQTYAEAIFKTQLSAAGVPLACQWYSQHPLKERLMLLTRNQPHPARRAMALTLLGGTTLAACYGAWASEQTTPVGSANNQDGYTVAFAFTREVTHKDQTNHLKFQFQKDLAIRSGEKLQLNPDATIGCDISIELQPTKDKKVVELDMPIRCQESDQKFPKLSIAGLGVPYTVQISKSTPTGTTYAYTVALTINRWPVNTPWPAPNWVAQPSPASTPR